MFTLTNSFEKLKPAKSISGAIVGMDSNYKNGSVFSNGQIDISNAKILCIEDLCYVKHGERWEILS